MKKLLFPIILFILVCSTTPYYIKLPILNEVTTIVDNTFDFVPDKYYDIVWTSATEYDIPPLYLARLLYEESKFNPKAINVNSNGTIDKGIAQLNDAYIEEFGWRYKLGDIDPFNPNEAIPTAAKHLSVLYKNTFASNDIIRWYLVMCAYNCGLSKTKRMEVPTKTTAYARRIIYGNN